MSAVSALILVTLTFIHGSCAIKCWVCYSGYAAWCNDPLDTSNVRDIRLVTCLSIYDACWRGEGYADSKNADTFHLVM